MTTLPMTAQPTPLYASLMDARQGIAFGDLYLVVGWSPDQDSDDDQTWMPVLVPIDGLGGPGVAGCATVYPTYEASFYLTPDEAKADTGWSPAPAPSDGPGHPLLAREEGRP